jgi:hypothetical protein
MEKAFLEQAANVNVADRELMENGEKVRRLCSILISGQEKRISSWEHNLETKMCCRPTEYFCYLHVHEHI